MRVCVIYMHIKLMESFNWMNTYDIFGFDTVEHFLHTRIKVFDSLNVMS